MCFNDFIREQRDLVAENHVVATWPETQIDFTVRYVFRVVIEICAVSVGEVEHLIFVDNPNINVIAATRCGEASREMPSSITGNGEGIVLIFACAHRERRIDNSLADESGGRFKGYCSCGVTVVSGRVGVGVGVDGFIGDAVYKATGRLALRVLLLD